jgi:Plasmid replication region DNA-binding N-term
MSDVLPDEARVATEIDRLKAEFPKTRELYREVCALLFFRFGITPTANRLYQLVRRGSMSTPTQVLGEFWTELREKSRVRIEHPDLPAELQAAAGELVATLWTRSTASAQGALDTLRAEVEAERAAAQNTVTSMQGELGRTETARSSSAPLPCSPRRCASRNWNRLRPQGRQRAGRSRQRSRDSRTRSAPVTGHWCRRGRIFLRN